ncbi:uncharacterized protein LOC135645887 isoform X2 [Musa acuminata AAA Group]|uniref:uncharacterized protein LOC135645887 isoform X2 n=1 Tax=Musa acuminata AAA Group TaxID=214697 RepID=UPI0031D1A1D9
MAGEGDRGASGGAEDDLPIFNAENLQSNIKSIYYSRTFLSIIGGVIAGIWGFTGLTGFIFYFLAMAAASFGLAAQAKFSVCTYFDSWNRIFLDGIFGGLMLTWRYRHIMCTAVLDFVKFNLDTSRFAYDIVHIFLKKMTCW